MDKQQQIEEMAIELHCATNESLITCRKIARILVEKRGYGNVEQAIKEFAEKLKNERGIEDETYGSNVVISYTELNELVREFYDKEEG